MARNSQPEPRTAASAAEQAVARELRRIAERSAPARGMLPHEFLAAVASGQHIEQVITTPIVDAKTGVITGYQHERKDLYPDLEMRIDAAKAAAPYYAPRLSTTFAPDAGGGTTERWRKLSDAELDSAIKLLSNTVDKNVLDVGYRELKS